MVIHNHAYPNRDPIHPGWPSSGVAPRGTSDRGVQHKGSLAERAVWRTVAVSLGTQQWASDVARENSAYKAGGAIANTPVTSRCCLT